ncbi:MAG: DJ-1/PfpI family protein [Polyangiaceae bacterium]|nr:DJ-1/PfpI family protein [Polyangiaceae bacterium]
MASVLVLLATGAEEMETTITVDVLRRGGIQVTLAGVDGSDPVLCSRGVRIVPDIALTDAKGPFDMIVLPGGNEGARRLAESSAVGALLREQEASGKIAAAICAAPTALAAHGVFAGRKLTAYPTVRDRIASHGSVVDDEVVDDRNLVTSQGPGTTFSFALALVEKLAGKATADSVRKGMLLP